MLELLEFLESLRSLYALTFSCRVGSEKLKSAGGLVPGSTGAGEEVADGADAGGVAAGVTRAGEIVEAAGVGADEDVTSNLVCCAIGAGDGEDAAEGEDLEESSEPGAVAEAAAESLFLRWKLAARSLSRWVFLGDFFFKVEVSFGRGFRRHLEFSCRSLG